MIKQGISSESVLGHLWEWACIDVLQVTSRGRVVDAGTVHSSSFSLLTDHSWTPLACVMVYHTLPDGEIVNDALQVTFTQVLRNTVRLHHGIYTCLEIQH